MTIGPARALSLDRRVEGIGTLKPGASADIVLFDPAREWTEQRETILSKGKNTPVLGMMLRGLVVTTIFGGNVVHETEGVIV
jgi:dihydroorotase